MQGRPAGALPNLSRARRERGIDGAGRRWLFTGRVPTAGQDQRPGAVLWSTRPPWLENGCGESAARFAKLDQSTSNNRSGGGRTEIRAGIGRLPDVRDGSRTTGDAVIDAD